MELRSGSWGTFDPVRPSSSPSCDQGRLRSHFKVERIIDEPQHDQRFPPQPHKHGAMGTNNEQFNPSHSQRAEIQQIIDSLGHTHSDVSADFELFDSTSAGPTAFQPASTLNNIDSITTSSIESQTYGIRNATIPYDCPVSCQKYDLLPTTNVPPDAFHHLALEHDSWPAPAYSLPTGMPSSYSVNMPSLGQMHYPQPEAHHLMDGPSPMLSQGSALHTDFVDGWDQRDIPQHLLENSGSDELNDPETADPCYAQLLYRCLREAPDHTMALRDLYDWVKEHSQKAKDPKNRGWQNSVRHNLSMNAAFERVPLTQNQGVKKGSLWRLTPLALRDGVISTTRYRKDPKRKPERRSFPALKRQISGAKGGQATRNATRRQQALREVRPFPKVSSRPRQLHRQRRQDPEYMGEQPYHATNSYIQQAAFESTSPYFLDMDENMPAPMSNPSTPAQVQLMFETQPKVALSNLNFGPIDFTNGALIGSHDSFSPDTPSLATEASYMSEDAIHNLMSHTGNGDLTNFPVDC